MQKLRVVTLEGKPWFVASDICTALGLLNTANACRIVEPQDQQVVTRTTNRELFSLGRGSSRLILVSRQGLYRLINRSDKPQARPFQRWLEGEVLPAIQQDGAYISGEEKVRSGEMSEDELVLKAVSILQKKVERLTAERDVAQAELNRVTVDEYRALMHAYWDHSFRVRLGQLASALCKARGLSSI